jgi:hypothetical protein
MGGQVAHISAEEADLLKRRGGAGTINPVTGLPEYQMGFGAVIREPGPLYANPQTGKQPPPGFQYVPNTGPMASPTLQPLRDTGPVYLQAVPHSGNPYPVTDLGSLTNEQRGIGGGGAPAPRPIEIRGRTPRTYIGPTTEQEIFEYATGVRPGGFPSFLSGAFTSGGPQTEQAVVDQFIGTAASPTTGSTTSEQEIVDQFVGSAQGGSVFEGQVHTTGDGMSDDRRFDIVEARQAGGGMGFYKDTGTDAVIARDEYVWPADAVAMLGNGSSNAGADILDSAVKNIRHASTGQTKQVNEIDGRKELNKALTT